MKLQDIHSDFPAIGFPAEIGFIDNEIRGFDRLFDLTGKVVFVTVQDTLELPALAAVYLRAGACLAILESTGWALHLLSSRPGEEGLRIAPPISCSSWVNAVERVIAQFGPIDLWLDTRSMVWPPVSRIGGPR